MTDASIVMLASTLQEICKNLDLVFMQEGSNFTISSTAPIYTKDNLLYRHCSIECISAFVTGYGAMKLRQRMEGK